MFHVTSRHCLETTALACVLYVCNLISLSTVHVVMEAEVTKLQREPNSVRTVQFWNGQDCQFFGYTWSRDSLYVRAPDS